MADQAAPLPRAQTASPLPALAVSAPQMRSDRSEACENRPAVAPSRNAAGDSALCPAHCIPPTEFRNLMRNIPSAVAILATDGPAGLAGLTATAYCSVSDTPATILACVNRESLSHAPLLANGCFSLNVLTADQKDLAEVFAGRDDRRGATRFGVGQWERGPSGAPVLGGTLLSLDCRLVRQLDGGTHGILIGEVVWGISRERSDCLLYARGAYQTGGIRPLG